MRCACRHLSAREPWVPLAVGLAAIAAAVDLVGVVIKFSAIPPLADAWTGVPAETLALQIAFASMESLAYALGNVTAFGLYSFAGVLLLLALFSTADYPHWLAWLGLAEWIIALGAAALLVITLTIATRPLLISFFLFASWVWG